MPRRRWIDKNSAQTFQLLYRSQNDPLLNDDSAGERALFQVSGPASSSQPQAQAKGLRLTDLEDDLDFDGMRENEGEAAEYGIYYDDTSYDYMQHLRDVGEESEQAYFIDATPIKAQGKGKGRAKTIKLEDALRQASLEDGHSTSNPNGSVVDDGLSTFSISARPKTYQDQQDVPDAIAGFQPDMDPRLREVLEALDDDAYVDEKDEEDVFGALAQEGRNGELDLEEFEATFEDDDEGWESDVTEKAIVQEKEMKLPPDANMQTFEPPSLTEPSEIPDAPEAVAEDGDWLRDFAKYKRDAKKPAPRAADSIVASSIQGPAQSLYTLNGTPLRQKKRKGAQTNPSAYSMTSSSLARTDGQLLLDARFDQVEKMYALDEEDEFADRGDDISLASGMSRQSRISTLSTTSFADEGALRSDFDSMMDGFLDGWDKSNPGGGKRRGAKAKRGKNGNELLGLQQLDEVRAELGPARIRTQKA